MGRRLGGGVGGRAPTTAPRAAAVPGGVAQGPNAQVRDAPVVPDVARDEVQAVVQEAR